MLLMFIPGIMVFIIRLALADCKCVLMSGSTLSSRYFYRACQGALFPSPVQVGRQLDKLPGETRRNILSLSKAKVGSQMGLKPPFLSSARNFPKDCSHRAQGRQGTSLRGDDAGKSHSKGQSTVGLTDSKRGLSDDPYTLVSTEIDTLPYTKEAPRPPGESQPPPAEDSDCPDKTLDPSDLSLSSWITSTPLVKQNDSVQLSLPPSGRSQCVTYKRNYEERNITHPMQRTEEPRLKMPYDVL